MSPPRVITVYSRTPRSGKKTIAINTFLAYAKLKPGLRVLIVDFSTTEELQYSLQSYGKSPFTSSDFLSEIPEDTLVREALVVSEDPDRDTFVRVLPSSGCPPPSKSLLEQVKYRINALFFKDTIDILVFIVPVDLEESSITMATILQSDVVWIISTEKSPTLKMTRSTIQNFLAFLTVPTFLIVNMAKPPVVLGQYEQKIEELRGKLRHPIFYYIPWLPDLNLFSDDGIFSIENPHSPINSIFHDFARLFHNFAETERFEPVSLEDQTEAPPNAIFVTDRRSGESMFYYFFGKPADEMKQPALITAALNSIALMVSETAGRRGEWDLRSIDNGSTKIILRKGNRVVGILYSPVETETLSNLLSQFVYQFEDQFESAINDFSKTGRIGGFALAKELVKKVFKPYIFDIDTVRDDLRQILLAYATETNRLNENPEEIFRQYAQENISDPKTKELLLYEFTTPHNSRHKFLLDLNINPRSLAKKLEEETGKSLCDCTLPPRYVQIQRFDALGILDLPEELRPTARALFISDVLSPETAAKITKREQEFEHQSLEALRKLGYVKRISPTQS
ncbi:MAG: hypothetical protein ACFFE8_00460 [Candidatus Heimdallarchaeota archaeon]